MLTRVSYETIRDLLYKTVTGEPLSLSEQKELKQWLSGSVYNNRLYNEILTDKQLNAQLCQADKVQFWRILLTHRTALHDGFGRRKRNFWIRIVAPFRKLFQK